ncbi:MAG: cytochrome c, partial [Pseudomonadota bacterium]
MNALKSKKALWLLALPTALVAVAFGLFIAVPNHTVPVAEPVDQYVYLGQGWGDEAQSADRQTYYFTGQGTSLPQGDARRALRYDWFVNLEMPLGQARFADPQHMRAYRFIVDAKPTPANPDHLPVGFARHYSETLGTDVLDITCAACHTGQLHYTRDNTRYAIRVDGGQAMHAFTDVSRGSFGTTLLASLTATWINPAKFNRFAARVLGEDAAARKSELHDQLGQTLRAFAGSGQNNPFRHLYPTREGY